MTTFKAGDVVRAKSEEDLRYLNAWSNIRIGFDTDLVVQRVGKDCLYFKEVYVGAYPWRFVPAIITDRPLESYL